MSKSHRKQSERNLNETLALTLVALDNLAEPITVISKDFKIKWMNRTAREFLMKITSPLKSMYCYQCHHNSEKPCDEREFPCPLKQLSKSDKSLTIVHEHYILDGTKRFFEIIASPLWSKEGTYKGIVEAGRDITERKKAEKAVKTAMDELEVKVNERTTKLKSTIELLRKAKKKLRIHTGELEESNAALKVLLKQRENDRKEFEDNILSNMKHLILPYIEKLKKNRSLSDELDYFNILESNLNEIVSPFSSKLSFRYMDFTPKEILVAGLVKDGKQDKDIVEILNVSPNTAKTHRQNIRKKLGISGKKINLRTKLLSLNQ
jgi:DNA-binding CsgD family transcriptional regulator